MKVRHIIIKQALRKWHPLYDYTRLEPIALYLNSCVVGMNYEDILNSIRINTSLEDKRI